MTSQQVYAKARESYAAINTLFGNANGKHQPRFGGVGPEYGKHLLEDPKEAFKEISQRYPKYWAWRYWRSYEDELVNLLTAQAALKGFAPGARRTNPRAGA